MFLNPLDFVKRTGYVNKHKRFITVPTAISWVKLAQLSGPAFKTSTLVIGGLAFGIA